MDVDFLFEDKVLEKYKSPTYLKAESLCLIFQHNLYNYFNNLTGHQDLEGHREQYASLTINTFYNLLDPSLRKKIPLESILQFFNQNDYNCEGKLYASVLYPLYRRSRYGVESFEESNNIFAKSKCIPGVVDIFLNDLPQSFQHIIEFVARNRASSLLVTPDLARPLLRLFSFRSFLCHQLNQPAKKRVEKKVKGSQGSRETCVEVEALLDTLAITAPSQHPLNAFKSVFEKIHLFPLSSSSSSPPRITFYHVKAETLNALRQSLQSLPREAWVAEMCLWLELIYGDVDQILQQILLVEMEGVVEVRRKMMAKVEESIHKIQSAIIGDKKHNKGQCNSDGVENDFAKIFSLLSLVFCCQPRKKEKKYNFEKFINAEVDDTTGVVRRKISHDFNTTLVVAKHPLTRECPSFEIELNKNTTTTDCHDVCVGLVYKDYNHSLRTPGNNNFTVAYDAFRYNVNSGFNSYYLYSNFRLCNKIKFQVDFEENRVYMVFRGEEKMYKEIPANLPLHPAFTIKSYSTITLPDSTPWRPYLSLKQEQAYIPHVHKGIIQKALLHFHQHVDVQTAILKMVDSMVPFLSFTKKECKIFRDVTYNLSKPLHLPNMGDVLCCSNHQRNKYFHMYLDKMLSKEADKETNTRNKAMFLCMCASMSVYSPLILSLPSSTKQKGFNDKLLNAKKTFFKILDASKFFSSIQARASQESSANKDDPEEGEEHDVSAYYSLLCVVQSGVLAWLKKQEEEEEEEEEDDKGKSKKDEKSLKSVKDDGKKKKEEEDDDVMKGEEEEKEKLKQFYVSYLDRLVRAVSNEMQMLAMYPDDAFISYLDNPSPSLLFTVFRQLLLWLEGTSRAVESLRSLSHCHSFVLLLVDKIKCLQHSNFRINSFLDTSQQANWFNQLLCSYYQVVGLLSSISIQVLPDMKMTRKQLESQNAPELDHKSSEVAGSELWRSIFRAGQLNFNRKFVERSYSGKHEAVSESDVLSMLWQLCDAESDSVAQNFLSLVQKKSQSLHVTMGGPSVTSSIVTLFAALCWHTQVIRQDLEKYVEKFEESKVSDAIVHAYIMAEKSRLSLMKKRQGMHHNQSISEENAGNESAEFDAEASEESIDLTVCPIEKVRLKARYLLNFAGIVQQHTQRKETSLKDVRESKLIKLYPSFPLVLQFVNDNSWSQSEVDRLLSERRMVASRLAEGYHLIICALKKLAFQRTHDNDDDGDCGDGGDGGSNTKVRHGNGDDERGRKLDQKRILNNFYMTFFLAGLLSKQHNFSKGHSENIDGCGLTLETRLRKQFYALIKLLIKFCANSIDDDEDEDEGCKDDGDDKLNVFKKQYKSLITVVTLHFLDTRWQVDDLPMLVELNLPSFLFRVLEEKRRESREGTDVTKEKEGGKGDKGNGKKKGTIWDYTNGSIYQLRDDYTNMLYGPATYVTAADPSKQTAGGSQTATNTIKHTDTETKAYISIEEYLWRKHFSGDDLDVYKTHMQWIKEATSMETSNFKAFYCDLTNFQNDLLTKLFLCRYRMLLTQYYQCDLCHRSITLKSKKAEKMAKKNKKKKKKNVDKLSDVFSISLLWGEGDGVGGDDSVDNSVKDDDYTQADETVDNANDGESEKEEDDGLVNGNNNNTNENLSNNAEDDVVDLALNGHDDRRNSRGNDARSSSSSSSFSSDSLFSDDENEEPNLAFRCLECTDTDCCVECFSKLSHPKCAGHQMVLLRWVCKGCCGAIIGRKYKCLTCKKEEDEDDDGYYCYGCFHTNHWEAGSDCSGHKFEVTRVPRARVDHTEDCSIDSYIQQQTFLLISYLSLLSRHHLINSTPLTPDLVPSDDCVIKSLLNQHDVTNEYLCSASSVYKECVEKLADMMKGVWKNVDKVDRKMKKEGGEGDKKDKMSIEVKRKSFKDIWNWHEILPALFCRLVGTKVEKSNRGVSGCDVINMAGDAEDKKLVRSLPELFSSKIILKTLILLLQSPHDRSEERKMIIIITILTRIIMHATECSSDVEEFIQIMINLASNNLKKGNLAVAKCALESLQSLLLSNVVVAEKIEDHVVKHLSDFQEKPGVDIHSYVACAYVFAGFPKIPCYGTLAKSKTLSIDKNTLLILGKVNKGGNKGSDGKEEDEGKEDEQNNDDDEFDATYELIQVHDRSKIELPMNQLKLVNVEMNEYTMKEHSSQSLLEVLRYVMKLTYDDEFSDEHTGALTRWFCFILMKAIHNSNNNNNNNKKKKNMSHNNKNNNITPDNYGGMSPHLLCYLLAKHLEGTSINNKWVSQHFEMASLKLLTKKKKNYKKLGDDSSTVESENYTSQQEEEATEENTSQLQETTTQDSTSQQQQATQDSTSQAEEQPEASISQSSIQTDTSFDPQHTSASQTSIQTDSSSYEQQQLNHYRNFSALAAEQVQQLKELYLNCDPLNDIPDNALKMQLAFMCEDENNLNRYVCRALYNLYFPRLQDLMDSLVAAAESREAWTVELKKELELVEYVYKGIKRPKKTEETDEEEDEMDETVDMTFRVEDFVRQVDPLEDQADLSDDFYSEEFMLKSVPLFDDQSTDDDDETSETDKNKMDSRLRESRDLFKRILKREGGLKKVLNAVSSHYSSLLLAQFFTSHSFPSIVHLYNSFLQSASVSSSSPSLAQTTCSLAVIKLMTKCLFDDNFLKDLSYKGDVEHDKTDANTSTTWCKTFVKNIISSSSQPLSDLLESYPTSPLPPSDEQLQCMRSLTEVAFDMLEGWKTNREVTIKGNQPAHRISIPNAAHLYIQARRELEQGKVKVQVSSSKDMISQFHTTFPGDENRVYIKGTKAYFMVASNVESLTLEIEAYCKHSTCFNAGWTLFEACIDLPCFKLVVDVQRFWRVLIGLVNRIHGKNRLKLVPLLGTLIKNNNDLNFELLSPLWGYFLKLVNQPRKPCDAELTKEGNYLFPAIHLALVDLFRQILNACEESDEKMEKFQFMVDFDMASY